MKPTIAAILQVNLDLKKNSKMLSFNNMGLKISDSKVKVNLTD